MKRGLVKMGLFDDSVPYPSVISVEWDLGCRWVYFLSLPIFFAYYYWSKIVWVFRLFAFKFLSGERMLLTKLLGEEGGFCLS